MNTQDFINKAKSIHGDKYDYSKTEYVNSKTKVCIICPEHGEFWQVSKDHTSGCGCPKCYETRRGASLKLKTDDYIKRVKEVHGDKYDYTKVEYKNSDTKICIICPEHGEFLMNPRNHLKGQGCPTCANLKKGSYRKKTTKDFIEISNKVHNYKYDYSKVEYKNNYTKVCIICPEHGEFWQKPNDHMRGIGCFFCGQKYNLRELETLEVLKTRYKNVIYQHKENFLQSKTSFKSIDFYLPDYNIGVEYHGRQHFIPNKRFGGEEEFEKTQIRDKTKYEKCLENGITLLYLSYEMSPNTNYFTKVYDNIDELLYAIDEIIKEKITNV